MSKSVGDEMKPFSFLLVLLLIIPSLSITGCIDDNTKKKNDEDKSYVFFESYAGYGTNYIYNVSLNKDLALDALNKSINISIENIKLINLSWPEKYIDIDFDYNMSNISREVTDQFNNDIHIYIEKKEVIIWIWFHPQEIGWQRVPNNESEEFFNIVNSIIKRDREMMYNYIDSLVSLLEDRLNLPLPEYYDTWELMSRADESFPNMGGLESLP